MPVKVRRRPGPLPANGGELAGENESRAVGRPMRRSGRLRSTLPSFRKRRWVTAPQGESGQSPLGGFGAPEPKESSAGQQSLVSVGTRPKPDIRRPGSAAAKQSSADAVVVGAPARRAAARICTMSSQVPWCGCAEASCVLARRAKRIALKAFAGGAKLSGLSCCETRGSMATPRLPMLTHGCSVKLTSSAPEPVACRACRLAAWAAQRRSRHCAGS